LSRTLYDGLDCASYAAARFNAVKNKYEDTKPLWGMDAGQAGTFQWSYDERVDGRLFDGILVVQRVREIYQGGAHGSREKEYYVLDTAAQKRLRLADFVPAASLGALRKLAEAELAAVYAGRTGQKPGESQTLRALGFFEDSAEIPADNFFLSPRGLGFAWNPYQIAPYSYGIIEITLPYARLRSLLTPKGGALLSKLSP
jgi:hypothetical protein